MRCATFAVLLCLAPTAAAAADEGALLYAARCSSCHGDRGQGSESAPPLAGKSATDVRFMLGTGRMPAAAAGINEIHRRPAFTPRQIEELVRYVGSFASGSTQPAAPRIVRGNVARGRELFTANCAACHGVTGDGASVGYGNVAPSLHDSTPQQVAEAVRVGPGVMPQFGSDVLSDRDLSDVVAYVGFIQHAPPQRNPGDAGGISLHHVGPVAEGFVAWLFGLGALVLFIRKIGTT
ncbi:MAG: c-type cytochrome [Candidatus Eremiobacteraeota bacterium]|nr:c-type cytochrome [Candidatus Eremiobacteraeota bacterium]